MKPVVKLSVACVALAATLNAATALGGLFPLAHGVAAALLLAGQTQAGSEAANRQEADKLLGQARQALKTGKLELAESCVAQAEKLNVKYDPLLSRFADTPEKLRREILAMRTLSGNSPRTRDATTPSPAAVPTTTQGAATSPPASLLGLTPREPGRIDRLPPVGGSASLSSQATPRSTRPESPLPGRASAQIADRPAQGAAGSLKAQALQLASLARVALDRGDLASAQKFAEQAESLRVPESEFGPGELRPWQVLLEIRSAANRYRSVTPALNVSPVAPPNGSFAVAQGLYQPENDSTRTVPAQAPTPATPGWQHYQDGLRALEQQDRNAALQHFRQAWQYQQELDPATRDQLKDKLSLLGAAERMETDRRSPTPLEEASVQQELVRQRLFREITSEQHAAEQMKATDPRGALARLQQLRERIGQTQVDPAVQKQLLTLVDRSVQELDVYVKQHQQEIALNERNQKITSEIELDAKRKLEVKEKIAELVNQFNKLVDEERFSEADVIARQVRELDPDDPVARLLVLKSRFNARENEQRELREQNEQGFYDQMTSVQESGRPFDDRKPMDFGDTKRWNQLTGDRKKWLESQQRKLSPLEQQIQESLKRPIDVKFNERPLKEVLETLGSMAGINIHADPLGLAAEGVTSDTPVTLNLSQPISLKSALDLILEPLRLSHVIQSEVLLITSESTRNSKVFAKVYNVADLVIPIPNFVPGYNTGLPAAIREAYNALGYGGVVQPVSMSSPMPLTISADETNRAASVNSSVLAQSGAYGMLSKTGGRPSQPLGYGPAAMGGGAMADFDTLITLITTTIEPSSWDDLGGPGAIEPFPTNLSLVISQTQDVHDQIVDLLAQLRRLQDLQVTIEVRFITLRDDWFERIGIDFDFDIDDNVTQLRRDDSGPSTVIGLTQAGRPTQDWDISFNQGSFGTAVPDFGGFDATTAANFGFAILSDIEVFFLLNAAEADKRSNVLQAPKVTLFNGQLASVSDTSSRPFVTSLIPVVGDFAAAHQPVIVVLSQGTQLSVQAVVSSDKRFVRLTLVPFFSQIGDVEEFTFTGTTSTNTGSNVVDPDGKPTGKINNAETVTSGTTVQLPTFSFTTVSTTVSVPDGGTVLLGGIKRLKEGRNEEGVPMLSKLPYINRLFKNVGIGRETQSLMLMVTPRILIQEEEEAKLGIEVSP